jgi:ornithine carbamoyltransferase
VKIPKVKSKDLVSVTDLSRKEIMSIFRLASKLKRAQKKGKRHEFLCGKSLAMIFEKRSTRTRVSFEVGMSQLGGHALFLGKDDIQLGRGETVGDTARVLSRYVDAIMIRTYSHASVMELAKSAGVPVINGLTDSYHPCQALTDFFTIYETRESFDGVKMAYVGDGNNMSNSLMLCAAILGADISVATPERYMPENEAVRRAMEIAAQSGSRVEVTTDPGLAAENADFIYTDVWVSMGQEEGAEERRRALAGYRISRALLEKCAPGCRVMHCLPAHRGEEIDADVMDSDMSIVFEQAENRLHIQKALLCTLILNNT